MAKKGKGRKPLRKKVKGPGERKRTKTVKKKRAVPRRARPRPRGKPPLIPIMLLIVSACLLLGATIMPWGGLNVETKLGIIPVSLKADVYEYGVSYEADLSGSEGIIQSGANVSKIEDERIFLTGLGKFQETIGFVKGSSKLKNHTIEVYTLPHNYNAKLLIETYAASIPWWPVGVPQDVSVNISIIEPPDNITHVEVKKVWFELHRIVDGKEVYKKVWGSSPEDKLKKEGDSKSYPATITADANWGKFSIVGRAELELIDKDGVSNGGKEFRSFSGNPKMIDLWTISQDKIIQIVLMVAAFPVTIIAAVLLAISMFPMYIRKSWAWKLAAVGAVLGILSIIFFMLGVSALIDLTGYIDWFEWNFTGLGIAILGSALAFVATGLAFKARPPKPRTKKKRVRAVAKRRKVEPKKGIKTAMEEEEPLPPPDQEPETISEGGAWMPFEEE